MEKDIASLQHTTWRCQYHVVFAPKYRRMAIYGQIRADIGQILRKLCEQKGVEIIQAQACPDHIHILISIPPKYSLKRYLFRQVGPSLKTYLTIMDGDIDPLLHVIAGSRMNDRQEELVRSALPQQRQRQLDFLALNEEYQRLLQDVGS